MHTNSVYVNFGKEMKQFWHRECVGAGGQKGDLTGFLLHGSTRANNKL
jgi:hypothetical protein